MPLVAEAIDAISGGGGWLGAGLLGMVLGWLLMRHLPEKDRQLKELLDAHARALEARDALLRAQADAHRVAVDRVVLSCQEEARQEREAGEKRFHEGMAALARVQEAARAILQSLQVRTRLADALQSADVPAWTKTLEGVLFSFNPAAERVLGWTQGEAVGRSVYTTVIPPDRRQEEEGVLRRIAAGETVEEYETVRLARNGRRVPLRVVTSPIRDQTGRIIGASTIARALDAG
jgi:PAS domain S-box-containing protein